MKILRSAPSKAGILKKLIEKVKNRFCLNENELKEYFSIILFSIPVCIYFIIKLFQDSIPEIFVGTMAVYVICFILYLFFTSGKDTYEKLIVSFFIIILFAYINNLDSVGYTLVIVFAVILAVVYCAIIYLIIYNRYYNMVAGEEYSAGLIMFAKKYAIWKFDSEFVASCIKINEEVTRNKIKKDIDDFHNRIKCEMCEAKIEKSIAEYSEEKLKKSSKKTNVLDTIGDFNKGFVILHGGIRLPIIEFNGGVPVVYLRGLDNHITKTTDFARKCKVGIDQNGQNYIYPITPYLNSYELKLFTDVDNIINRFSQERLKNLDKEHLNKELFDLDKVLDCSKDFLHKIKETIDFVRNQESETEIERGVRQDIEKLEGVFNIYKLEVERRQNRTDSLKEYQEFDGLDKDKMPKRKKNGAQRWPSKPVQTVAGIPMVKGRQEVFAEGIDELEALIGLNGIKDDIKQYIDKYKIDKYAKGMGLAPVKLNNNFVLIGKPGTGKETVARIIAKLLFGFDIIKTYEVLGVSKTELLGDTAEETEIKTRNILNECIQRGCLLFVKSFEQVYKAENGIRAIKLIHSAYEACNDRFACIISGYPIDTLTAIKKSGSEIESMFPNYMFLENQKVDELVKIFESGFCGTRYQINHEARQILKKGFMHLIDAYPNFAYGRDARKIFEKSIRKQTSRLAAQKGQVSKEKLMLISYQDIEKALEEFMNEKNKMEGIQEIDGEL